MWQRKNPEPITLTQEEVYLTYKAKIHRKRRFKWTAQKESLRGRSETAGLCGLRNQVTEAKAETLEPGSGGLARDKLELPTAPLVLSLMGTLELRRKKAGACFRESMCSVRCLRVFISFSKG